MLNILEATPVSTNMTVEKVAPRVFFRVPSICHAIRQTPVVDVKKKKTKQTKPLVSDIPCKLGISDGIAVGKLGKISQMSDLFGYFY